MAKKKRKRYNPSRHLPAIEPHPNLDPDKIVHLPKIIDACQPTLRPKDVDKLKVRLNFADHRDFRKLGCIRIVNPETIRMPSKETTTGLYRPKHGSQKAEIVITSDLLTGANGIEGLFYRLIYKDHLFETLFHELGHHKARLMHSVDKFEDEAFADKYMLAYRKHWKSLHGPSKLYVIVLRCLVKMVRFITILLLFPFNTFNKELNLFYCYLKGEISFDVLIGEDGDPAGEDENVSLKQKKKWTHPLTKRKYRNRFSLPDR